MYIVNNAFKSFSKGVRDKSGNYSLWPRPATLFLNLPNAVEFLKESVAAAEELYKKNNIFVKTLWEHDYICFIIAKNEIQVFRITHDEPEDSITPESR